MGKEKIVLVFSRCPACEQELSGHMTLGKRKGELLVMARPTWFRAHYDCKGFGVDFLFPENELQEAWNKGFVWISKAKYGRVPYVDFGGAIDWGPFDLKPGPVFKLMQKLTLSRS